MWLDSQCIMRYLHQWWHRLLYLFSCRLTNDCCLHWRLQRQKTTEGITFHANVVVRKHTCMQRLNVFLSMNSAEKQKKHFFFDQLMKDKTTTDMVYSPLWEQIASCCFLVTLNIWNAQQSNCLVAIRCLFFNSAHLKIKTHTHKRRFLVSILNQVTRVLLQCVLHGQDVGTLKPRQLGFCNVKVCNVTFLQGL